MVPADPEPPIGYQAELPRPDANPDALRDDIPAVDDLVYFNAGASGPSPRRVVEAAGSFLECREYDAPGGEGTYPVAFDSFDETRAAIADRIGGEAEEIALTQSTAAGIARVAGALDWEAGDAVVRTDAEHPAGVLPWERLRADRASRCGRCRPAAAGSTATPTARPSAARRLERGTTSPAPHAGLREALDVRRDRGDRLRRDPIADRAVDRPPQRGVGRPRRRSPRVRDRASRSTPATRRPRERSSG